MNGNCRRCILPALPWALPGTLWRNRAGFHDALLARMQLRGFRAQPVGVACQEVGDDREPGIAVTFVESRQRLTRGLKEMAPASQSFLDRRNEHPSSILRVVHPVNE